MTLTRVKPFRRKDNFCLDRSRPLAKHIARRFAIRLRLDGGEWSPYGADMIRSFEDLDVGAHTLEVKARDLAFNEDPTPAVNRSALFRWCGAPVVYWVDCRVCGHYGLPDHADYCQGSETAQSNEELGRRWMSARD